jgi:hypothetical protein
MMQFGQECGYRLPYQISISWGEKHGRGIIG